MDPAGAAGAGKASRLAGPITIRRSRAGAAGGRLAVSAAPSRDRAAALAALVALVYAFATATAIFNTTYDTQSRVDALLTNGANVNVAGTSAAPASAQLDAVRALPGVAAAEPLMHRMAYVGADLQDISGVDTARIGRVTTLSNAYFSNHDAVANLAALRAAPDGILVADETVKDFQPPLGGRAEPATAERF